MFNLACSPHSERAISFQASAASHGVFLVVDALFIILALHILLCGIALTPRYGDLDLSIPFGRRLFAMFNTRVLGRRLDLQLFSPS